MASPRELLDRLAAREPTPHPFISLYLDARPNQRGRDDFGRFVRRSLKAAASRFDPRSPTGERVRQDVARIRRELESGVRHDANGVAVFACAADGGFFDTVQLGAPFPHHALFVGPRPDVHLLARVIDEHQPSLTIVGDTHLARLFVFELGGLVEEKTVGSPTIERPALGGWSQLRHRRHAGELQLHHAKAVAEAADALARKHGIRHLVLAGDALAVPVLRRQLPVRVARLEIAALPLDVRATAHDVFEAARQAIERFRSLGDRDLVAALLDRTLSRDQAALGLTSTLEALERGQVDTLLLPSRVDHFGRRLPRGLSALWKSTTVFLPAPASDDDARAALIVNDLVSRARRTHADVAFLRDAGLLADVGHVAARLRFPHAGTGRKAKAVASRAAAR